MLFVVPIQKEIRKSLPKNYHSLGVYEKLYNIRSSIPSVTHIDYSARLQSVNKKNKSKIL